MSPHSRDIQKLKAHGEKDVLGASDLEHAAKAQIAVFSKEAALRKQTLDELGRIHRPDADQELIAEMLDSWRSSEASLVRSLKLTQTGAIDAAEKAMAPVSEEQLAGDETAEKLGSFRCIEGRTR